MGKVSVEKRKNGVLITNKISYPEAVNDRIVQGLSLHAYEGLLPVQVMRRGNAYVVECEVEGLIPLQTYFSGIVSRNKFLNVVEQLAHIVQNCADKTMTLGNLDFADDRIFVDGFSQRVYGVFWPIVNNTCPVLPEQYFRELPSRITFDAREPTTYLHEYAALFSGYEPFSPRSFYRGVAKLRNSSAVIKNSLSELLKDKEEKSAVRAENYSANEYDPLAFLPQDNAVSPSFDDCEKTERNLYGVQPEEQPASRLAFSYLLRVKTNERILLRTPRFRIGKSRERCDYRVEDNTTVSRVHADFLTKNGRVYVVDLGSSNKTFVNGHSIPPQTEVEITHNTKIYLSNEEFVLFTR